MKPIKVFIIQPFGATHSEQFRKIVLEVCDSEDMKCEFVPFLAIDSPSSEPRLQDRINDYLKKSDICVADLTGMRNENALLEVGAAYALSIPVVPCSDKELPSDIKGNLYINVNPKELSDVKDEEEFKKKLKRRFKDARDEIGTGRSDRYLSHVFKDRGAVDFYSLIARSENRIDVLTTNLNYLVNEDLDCIEDKEKMTFLEIIAEELKSKKSRFQLRILAMDPDCNFTNQRALALGRNRQIFREQMREDLETVKSYVESEDCTASAEVRIYDETPLQMTFFFDDIVVSSVVAASRSSRYCVTYMHSLKELGAQESYERHFDQLWGVATPYAVSQRKRKKRQLWKKDEGNLKDGNKPK